MSLAVGTIGIATDIHANPFALERVLLDGEARGVERWLVLGDVVAMGPLPGEVLDQLADVEVVARVRGNTDRYVLTGERPDPTFDEVKADPSLLPRLAEVAGSFAWTKGYLQARGQLATLRTYQRSVRLQLPDGTRALGVHASLVSDAGTGIGPGLDTVAMSALFPNIDAALVFGGHSHLATDTELSGVRFINPGSVSNHDQPDDGARYSVLRAGADGHHIEHHEVAYDKGQVTAAIRACGIPGSTFLLDRYFSTSP